MLVKEIMAKDVRTAQREEDMETVAMKMWEYDRGFIPIVDEQQHLTGVVTDRDICMSSAMNHKPLWEMSTKDVTQERPLVACKPGDEVSIALDIMKKKQLHRLPVVDENNVLMGVVGLADIVSRTNRKGKNHIAMEDTVETLKGIYSPR